MKLTRGALAELLGVNPGTLRNKLRTMKVTPAGYDRRGALTPPFAAYYEDEQIKKVKEFFKLNPVGPVGYPKGRPRKADDNGNRTDKRPVKKRGKQLGGDPRGRAKHGRKGHDRS